MKVVIFCYLLAFCCCLAAAESVPCEIIGDDTCYMRTLTVIDSPGVLISSTADTSIRTLQFYGNKKIEFLPLNASEKFPSLETYDAGACSIETITKENFNGLSKLRNLYLIRNKIEKVPSDVFEGLTALEFLRLDYNQIKFINSAAFRGLSNLRDIDLRGNVCIQGWYQNATSITSMIHTLTDKCGFYENPLLDDFSRKTSDQVNKISESLTSIRKEQQEQGSTSNSLIRETKAEIKAEIVNFRNKNAESFASIEAELQTAKAQMKTDIIQLQASTNQTATYQQEIQSNAVKLALCKNELKSGKAETEAAKEQLTQKQMTNEKLETKISDLQIAKAQMEGKVKTLNQQMEQRTLELENAQAENTKNLMKIDQQATTITSLTSQNQILSNNFEECILEKVNIDVELKLSNARLDVFKGIDIGKFREEIRKEFGLLRNTNTCVGQIN